MSTLQVGDKAPSFTTIAVGGEYGTGTSLKLSDLKGQNVVLYFYPKDDTPGCTAEACSLRDGFAELRAAGAVILGVSADTGQSHKAFAEKFHLPFSLLADPDKKIIEAYGVKIPIIGIAKRVTFIIDKQGVVRRVISDVNTGGHDQQVLASLKELSK